MYNHIPACWVDVRVLNKVTSFPHIKVQFLLEGGATCEAWIKESQFSYFKEQSLKRL